MLGPDPDSGVFLTVLDFKNKAATGEVELELVCDEEEPKDRDEDEEEERGSEWEGLEIDLVVGLIMDLGMALVVGFALAHSSSKSQESRVGCLP